MKNLLSSLRPLARGLAPLMGALLLCGVLATSFHHHRDMPTHHECALCVSGHTPAVAAMAVAPTLPVVRCLERLSSPAADLPIEIARPSATTRAPPSV